VILATVQSLAMAVGLAGQGIAFNADLSFYFVAVVTLVSGAVFLMWLGEQVTEKGIGNGISILIFAGIVSGLPGAVGQSFEAARQGDLNIIALLAIAVLALATIAFVVVSVVLPLIMPSVSKAIRYSPLSPAICL
jgi:preprotein translocase subunit SecY